MKRCTSSIIGTLALLLSCSPQSGPAERRAEIRQVGPASIRVPPAAGKLPFCLIFTDSERGVVRHLTMTTEGLSVACEAGKPIGGVTYRIPLAEGKVHLYVLFSDQQLKAAPIATQIHELAMKGQRFTAMDLRAAGMVQLETLEFAPSGGGEPAAPAP